MILLDLAWDLLNNRLFPDRERTSWNKAVGDRKWLWWFLTGKFRWKRGLLTVPPGPDIWFTSLVLEGGTITIEANITAKTIDCWGPHRAPRRYLYDLLHNGTPVSE